MSLLKFRAFDKMRREVKEQKLKETEANRYKTFYTETLQKYGVIDASELDEENLTLFLDSLKTYRKNNL
jgi:hypothetical protein